MLMRKTVVLIALFGVSAAAQQKLTPEQMQEDFRVLRSALDEGHPGVYRYRSKPEMDRIFDAAAARLNEPMTALKFYRVAAPVVGAIKCGHTSLALPRELQRDIVAKPILPIEVRVIGGKVFVFRDY